MTKNTNKSTTTTRTPLNTSMVDNTPNRLMWRLVLTVLLLLAVLLVLTATGITTRDNLALGIPVLLAALLLTGDTWWRMFRLARFFLEPELSEEPREPGDEQQRLLQAETFLTLQCFFFLAAAMTHWAIYLLDSGSWSGLAERLIENGSGSSGESNHFLLFWLCLHDSIIAAIGAASATRFVVQSVAAQLWLDSLVYVWYLQSLLLVGQVLAAEFGRRERRRDHDPQTV